MQRRRDVEKSTSAAEHFDNGLKLKIKTRAPLTREIHCSFPASIRFNNKPQVWRPLRFPSWLEGVHVAQHIRKAREKSCRRPAKPAPPKRRKLGISRRQFPCRRWIFLDRLRAVLTPSAPPQPSCTEHARHRISGPSKPCDQPLSIDPPLSTTSLPPFAQRLLI